MENLKIQIKIKDNDDIKEAHDLLLKLGFSTYSKESFDVWINQPKPIWLKTNCFDEQPNKIDWCFKESHGECKEITLPELRDLVVLKRNDVGDATHTDGHYSFYVGKDKNYFFSSCDKAWRGTWKNVDILKPIEKPMKEYLLKTEDGIYHYHNKSHDECPKYVEKIEIPEGSCTATERRGDIVFWDNDGARTPFKGKFDIFIDEAIDKLDAKIIWQRHTIPEELPFIDDEPKRKRISVTISKPLLNDQYAEIEKVRQDIINSPIHYADSTIECIDAMEAMMTPEQFIGYLRGNVFKYQWRYEKKNGIEDLKKAQWYLERLTEKVAEKNAPF